MTQELNFGLCPQHNRDVELALEIGCSSSPQALATLLERKCHALLASSKSSEAKEENKAAAARAAEGAIQALQASGQRMLMIYSSNTCVGIFGPSTHLSHFWFFRFERWETEGQD